MTPSPTERAALWRTALRIAACSTLLVTALPFRAGAGRMLVLDETVQNRISIASCVDVLEDSTGELKIRDVSSPAVRNRFVPLDTPVFDPGKTKSVFWLRFTLAKVESSDAEWFLEIPRPFVSSLRLLSMKTAGNGWTCREAGDFRLKDASRFSGKRLVFSLPDDLRTPRTFYLRAGSFASLTLPIEACTGNALLHRAKVRMFWFGIYSGIILALVLYNLFLYRSLRDRSYLWYTLYVFPLALYFHGANGLISEYVFTSTPEMDIRLTLSFLAMSFVTSLMFARAFLLTAPNTPRFDRLLRSVTLISAGMIPVCFFAPFQLVTDWISVIGAAVSVMTIAAGITRWQEGFAPARFYLVAWSILVLCGMNYNLALNGFRPFHIWSLYGFQISSALEAILLSLALADRIKTMQRECADARRSESRFRRLAFTDGLTGLYNARFFRSRIARAVRAAHKENPRAALSLLLLDVDNFKRFNDTFGHPEGNRVLVRLGRVIRSLIRETDAACRYGGEEFAVILPGITIAGARRVGERIRLAFAEEYTVPGAGEQLLSTVSIGAAELLDGEDHTELLFRADQALYQAKRLGKNRTEDIQGESLAEA